MFQETTHQHRKSIFGRCHTGPIQSQIQVCPEGKNKMSYVSESVIF